METNKLLKKTRFYLAASLIAGFLLLATGMLFEAFDIHIIQNNKAIIGVSFIPLGLAFAFGLNINMMKKNPRGMRPILIAELDERVTALKHQADSITFRVLRWALALMFLGYTFAFPAEVFESAGWWITFSFFFLAFFVQAVVLKYLMNREKPVEDEETEQ